MRPDNSVSRHESTVVLADLANPPFSFSPIGKQLLKLGRFCMGLKCAAALGKTIQLDSH